MSAAPDHAVPVSPAAFGRDLLSTLERAYACPLDDVRVHAGPRAEAVTRALGVGAATWGDCVLLSERVLRGGHGLLRHVLAHELAHVAQKRLHGAARLSAAEASDPRHRLRVERDAAASAAAALAGARRPVRCADAPDALAAWGAAGHYYTIYFVALAAGMTEEYAQQLAFYVQMPDQVSELDAIQVASKVLWPKKGEVLTSMARRDPSLLTTLAAAAALPVVATSSAGAGYLSRRALSSAQDSTRAMVREAERRHSAEFEEMMTIQVGLHCLTGGSATTETAFRYNVATNLPAPGSLLDAFPLGLALHSYGDSFAHRRMGDSSTMYEWGMGHAVEGTSGHEPDNINNRRDLYGMYGCGVYDILRQRSPSAKPKRTRDELAKALDFVSDHWFLRTQVDALTKLAGTLGGSPNQAWRSEPDPIPFADFLKQQKDAAEYQLESARTYALDWRRRRSDGVLGDFNLPFTTPAGTPVLTATA